METKRPDESEDFAKKYDTSDTSHSNAEFELEDLISKSKLDQTSESQSRLDKICKTFIGVFCGFEEASTQLDAKKQNEIECQRRVENFQSLNQTKFEKWILNVNLVIILAVAVALYVFFSIPPEYHIFSHIKLNQTLVIWKSGGYSSLI